ncbi:MAG: hypothetical protein LBF22_04390 [Deltaproteobacteria bacterium]|nr:hypothetical protein [Deltaproteobacteria bacterium]
MAVSLFVNCGRAYLLCSAFFLVRPAWVAGLVVRVLRNNGSGTASQVED